MTFLEKLSLLMTKNQLNKHTLAEQCGVPYTTIVGLYERGPDNARLSTLLKICDFFAVPLDYMVYEKYEKPSDFTPSIPVDAISAAEMHLIALYRNAEDTARQIAVEILEAHQIQKLTKQETPA